MKKNSSSLLSMLSVGLMSLASLIIQPSQAAWYEVTGNATIVASEDAARLHALEDAIYKAAQFSGADIGNLPNLFPILESDQNEYMTSNHEVRYILVTDRQIKNNQIQLKVRIDIYPSASSCHTNQYKKTLLISNIDLETPQHAVMGQIYQIGDDFSSILDRQINQESNSFISIGTSRYQLDARNPQRTQMIAQDHGAQYLINGKITDLTSTISSKDETINRQFALELQVFDGKTGNEVLNRRYREVSRWGFAKTSQVDTRSARFWASSYGKMLLRTSRNIMLDLESELACKITLPEIVAKQGERFTMDLGRQHGVRNGDRLQLWHTGAFIDQQGIARNQVTQSDITLIVTRVYENNAELIAEQPSLAASIQIGDVMHKL